MNQNSREDATKRFSDRVEFYIKYRPSYPPAVIHFLKKDLNLSSASVIADIGSGTGFLAELFLQNKNLVFGVEPNKEMRLAGERHLNKYPNFRSVNGTAENTTLDSDSIDYVTAGQAFHWFDKARAKTEFSRILKPDGRVVLVWNTRRVNATPFLQAYEKLLITYGLDYEQVFHHGKVKEKDLQKFFDRNDYQFRVFDNCQEFDYVSLEGRLLSSSYVPLVGHPNFKPMLTRLHQIFEKYQENGKVSFEYDTELFCGKIK